MKNIFKLSIVVTSRNDNHGLNLNDRTQRFIDSVCYQAKKNQLMTELIFVEWNPPKNNKRLYEIFKFKNNKFINIKFYEVPYEEHKKIKNSEKIPLYQMIAKNVGIRRALGEYILATNIDIVFSDNIFSFVKNKIKPNIIYRVPRLDVDKNFAFIQSERELLNKCINNFYTIKSSYFTFRVPQFINKFPTKIRNLLKINKIILHISNQDLLMNVFYKLRLILSFAKNIFILKLFSLGFIKNKFDKHMSEFTIRSIKNPLPHLFTRACGDFTLTDKNTWFRLGGYLEVPYYSWLLDSMFLYQAHKNLVQEQKIKNGYVYHIDHDDGFSVFDKKKLFNNLSSKSVKFFTEESFYISVKKMFSNNNYVPNKDFGIPNGKIKMNEFKL